MSEKTRRLHKIQWQILKKMSTIEYSRFNELKPKEMDPKRFVYHLGKLKDFRLILHDSKKGNYFLTDRGKMVLAHYEDLPDIEDYFFQTFILLYIKRKGKILVVKRKKAPYLGYTGNPFVNIEKEAYLQVSASNALESLGLKGNLSLNLILEMVYKTAEGKVRTHPFIYVFYSEEPYGEAVRSNAEGTLFCLSPKELSQAEKGYDNTKDIVSFFENKSFDRKSLKIMSRTYSTLW